MRRNAKKAWRTLPCRRGFMPYVHSHTHLPMIFREAFFRVSVSNCSASMVNKLLVNAGACLGYGGYGQQQEYKPSSVQTPIITLEAARKRANATM